MELDRLVGIGYNISMRNKQMMAMLTACIFMWCAIAGSIMIGVGAMRVTRADTGNGPPWILDFKHVSTGLWHSLAITTDGRLFAWGGNAQGAIGDGTTANFRHTPVPIMEGTTFAKVSAGGHSLAITTDGRLFVWGPNTHGQIGVGTAHIPSPVHIMEGTTFAHISAGHSHSLVITTDGRLFAWGIGSNGQLGNGENGAEANTGTPVHIMPGTTFAKVSAGSTHSLGIATDGRLFAWGSAHLGRLGCGQTAAGQFRATPFHIMVGTTFSHVVASNNHSLGIATDGRLFAWGSNVFGQIGDGGTVGPGAMRSIPVHIMPGTMFSSISATGHGGTGPPSHSFGVTTDWRLFAWGANEHGQLGDGTTYDRHIPVHIMPGTLFTQSDSGASNSVGMTSDGRLFTWGGNNLGQLGDGTQIDRHTPTLIARPLNIQDLQNMIDQLRAQAQIDRAAIVALQKELEEFMLEMKEALRGQGERITALENRMTIVENDLEDLGKEIEKLQEAVKEIEDIQDRIDKMQGEIAGMNRQGLVDMIEDLEELLEDLQKELADLDFLEDYDLNEIRAKIAALELALGNIDLDLETEELRTQLQTILDDMLEAVLPGTLTVLNNRIATVETEIEELLYELEDIIAEILANMSPPSPMPRTGLNSEMLLYIGVAVFALGVVTMIIGTSVAVAAGRRKK